MTALLDAPLPKFVTDAPACAACGGSEIAADSDGSVTGIAGAVIPCECTDYLYGESTMCACHIEGWPLNGGFTGWSPNPLADREETTPYYRSCPAHNALAQLVTFGAVAA
jgi:hypothetical protein